MSSEVLERQAPAIPGDSGAPPPPPGERLFGDGGGGGLLGDTRKLGLWAFLGTVTMLFVGFTSALLLRRGSADWRPFSPPPLLFVNALLLLASSACLERARGRLRGFDLSGCRAWTWLTGALGVGFVCLQFVAWRQLADKGVFLASNPSSSFFYVLSGVHLLHLAGGLAWFARVAAGLRSFAYAPGEDGLGLFATYWHFLGGLWLYLLLVLFAL